ncbi:MAG: sirohydrochlorin chelatase [Planctomycetales bacterium]|nr:sirohydrochlorin chelatase [Planctomycetales bacterium]
MPAFDRQEHTNANIPQSATVGYLLVGHGTRDAFGVAQFLKVHQQMAGLMPKSITACGFLELAEPDISQAVATLAERGVTHLITIPLLLFTAGHAERDIPAAVAQAASRHGLVCLHQVAAFECTPSILSLSALRFRQAVCDSADFSHDTCAATSTCLGSHCGRVGLVMIGRGSSSAEATRRMRQFVEMRLRMTPVAWSQTAFIHAQKPSVTEALDELQSCRLPVAVVQPHLLFSGELLNQLREEAARRQILNPGQKWLITAPLGSDESLAAMLAERAQVVGLGVCGD